MVSFRTMNTKRTYLSGIITILTITIFVVAGGNVIADSHHEQCSNAQVTSINPQDQNNASYTASQGQIITGVCVKAGSDNQGFGHFGPFNQNGLYQDNCYQISGLGTSTVTVVRIGSGPTCKGISHLDVYTGTTPTPTPTPEITPTPTPPTRPTPTPTPEISPSPTPNMIPTPTPEVTPTPEITPTPTPETTPTPNTTPGPTPTPTPGAGGSNNNNQSNNSSNQNNGEVLGATTLAGTGANTDYATITMAISFVLVAYGLKATAHIKNQ